MFWSVSKIIIILMGTIIRIPCRELKKNKLAFSGEKKGVSAKRQLSFVRKGGV